jgi:hypothetical protein
MRAKAASRKIDARYVCGKRGEVKTGAMASKSAANR